MNDPAEIALQYRRFADLECKGYSDAYYRLALDVAGDDDVMAFVARMPVRQPNLFFASVQFLTGPDRMPSTGVELKEARAAPRRRRGRRDAVAPDADERGRALCGAAARAAVWAPGAGRDRRKRGTVSAPRPVP